MPIGTPPRHQKIHISTSGVTAIELMTVVGIIGIAATVAITTLQPYVTQYELRGASALVAAELARARLEAIRTRLCHFFVPDGTAGFRIVRDDPQTPNCVLDAADETVRNVSFSSAYPRVSFATAGVATDPYGNPVTGPTPASLRFEPRGLVTANGGSSIFLAAPGHSPTAVTTSVAGAIRTWRRQGSTWR